MEDWTRQADGDRDVLMRIVALLVAMADLADRAGSLSGRRRNYLLQLLWYAEAVGHDFILGLMPTLAADYGEPETDRDPARLAASFRVLALVLYTMLLLRPSLSGALRRLDAGCGVLVPAVRRTTTWAPDTS